MRLFAGWPASRGLGVLVDGLVRGRAPAPEPQIYGGPVETGFNGPHAAHSGECFGSFAGLSPLARTWQKVWMAASKQRIVAGTLGGRFLLPLPRGITGVRPSSSRVRSAICDRLQAQLDGRRVLDLFAGTGACAFEALSRGCTSALLVESQPRMAEFLRRQVAALELDDRCQLTHTDALSYLRRAASPGAEPADLVIIDPPYAEVELWSPLLVAVVASASVASDSIVVCERPTRHFPGGGLALSCPPEMRVDAIKRHGDTTLEFISLTR